MKFRTRLLILLLTVTLVPLGLSFLSQRASILHFGNKLAGETRSQLYDSAVTLLHSLVDDYDRILERDTALALLTLRNQAQAVEYRLNQDQPPPTAPLFFNADYTSPQSQPSDMVATSKRLRPTEEGQLRPIPISFSQQVIHLAEGIKRQQVRNELRRISTMNQVYQELHQIQPELLLWQYTALDSGIHSSYPGKGGYPSDYDPRQRQWYQDAVAAGEPVQRIMTDLSTKRLIMTLAQPVYRQGKELAGVTALDIDYQQFFADWQIPAAWADAAESMVLVYHGYTPDPEKQLEILLKNRGSAQTGDWRAPVDHEYLTIPAAQLRAIQQDFVTGQSAVRRVQYRGQETLWAYGSRSAEEPFPLVIVPLEQVLAKAVTAEKYVNQQIQQGLRISAALTIFVVIAAVLLAVVRARKVTDPVTELAQAANQLAAGNFDVKVDIRTADELRNLGRIFNNLGDSLKEREQMKQSLALAKEIQQELLPGAPPTLPGFELAARSHYCDETGGDYYDFIALEQKDATRIGLAVGDVSGHGIGAALVMAAARSMLRSQVNRHGLQLDQLYADINRHLCRDTGDAYFMTLFYGVLDPAEKTLYWSSARHAPIFLYRQGKIEELFSSGLPLGIIESTEFDPVTKVHLAPGDMLLVGTDGIWEARNLEGEMFGTQRVSELLLEHAALSATEIADRIISQLNAFRGDQPQDDDITLMVVKSI
jgi:sigma-B regulation protein RsbU (phosphoserine phosphatase)